MKTRALFVFKSFCALAAGLLLLMAASNMPAFAQEGKAAVQDGPGPKAAAAAKEAAANMQTYLRDLEKTGGQPDYSKPPASEYFKRIFDADALAALPAPKADDVSWLLQWFDASQTYQVMVNFGAKDQSPTPSFRAMEHNIQQYEDQMLAASAFTMRITARMNSTVLLFVASLPPDQQHTETRKEGIRRMNLGLMQVATGTVMMAAAPLKPKNLRLLASALHETVPVWMPIATSKERANILTLLEKARVANKNAGIDDDITATETAIKNVKE